MIEIEKNGTKYTVSKNTFEIYFKSLDYKPVKAEKVQPKVENKKEEKEKEKEKRVGDK